jgi:hypothetical protein
MNIKLRQDKPMSFLDHPEELRFTVIRGLLCYAVGFLIALPGVPYVLQLPHDAAECTEYHPSAKHPRGRGFSRSP